MDLHWKIAGACLSQVLSPVSQKRLPRLSGQVQHAGLHKPVHIRRDQWGIPHIVASNRADLFFAQGYTHAQDRLWQMEVNRRAAAGRLAEILGKQALATDRLTRTLGFSRLGHDSWKNTTDRVRADVTSYIAGVNAYLNLKTKLPVEFTLLRHEPEEWTVQDSGRFGRFMIWPLSHVWSGKLIRAQLLAKIGPYLAAELEVSYPESNPITLPVGIEFNALKIDGMFRSAKGPLLGKAMIGGSQGSNGWVIAGNRCVSGKPILCNDMHLPISTPSLWYFNHLACAGGAEDRGDFHATGVSLPGMPYVLVGHNEDIAWGATVSFLDNEDLFVEKLDLSGPQRYLYKGEWRPLKTFTERIRIRGKPDYIEEVRETHHGPVISNILPTNGQTLALQSVALQPEEGFEGFARLDEARGWDDFVRATNSIRVPPINLLYADTTGNIGYYVSGQVPIRAKGQGQIPVPGWSGDYEWLGYIPFEEMPHALNPKQGFIVSANNRIVGPDYPHYLGVSWRNGFRARRITELLKTHDKVSVEACRNHHSDVMSISGQEFTHRLADLHSENPQANISLDILKTWDGALDSEDCGGAVYKVMLNKLARAILLPRLGRELLAAFLGEGIDPVLYPFNELHGQWPATILRLLDKPDSDWWAPDYDQAGVLISCLAETTRYLQEKLGPDSGGWQWGQLHQIKFNHIMAGQPALDKVFSHGPFQVGGDPDTVAQTSVVKDNPGDNIAASYRQIIDMGDLASSIAMHVPGQSGNLASPHYGNLIQPWLEGLYYPMTWTEEQSINRTLEHLRMLPA
jgi:penicillin amidase